MLNKFEWSNRKKNYFKLLQVNTAGVYEKREIQRLKEELIRVNH